MLRKTETIFKSAKKYSARITGVAIEVPSIATTWRLSNAEAEIISQPGAKISTHRP